MSLIAVEQAIKVGEAQRRCDAVIYNRQMTPLMIIECKAETVALTQKTLDQAIAYNRQLQVPWLVLHNGPHTLVVLIDGETVSYPAAIPTYETLVNYQPNSTSKG